MRTHPAWLLLSVLSVAAHPAAAQQENSAIVVTGTKATIRTIARYVDSITSPVDDQIARFHEPICPAGFGLPAAYNEVVEQRLRQDAIRVGLRVAGNDCDPNIVVIVADDPAPLVAALRRKRPQMFVGLEYSQIEKVLRTNEPVRTWQSVQPRGSDGRPLQRVMSFNGTQIAGNGGWLNPAASNSRIQQNTQAELVASFVVIAVKSVDGLSLTQIADYAAMRTLASTRASPNLTSPTILALFNNNAAAPGELTAWDIGYLRGVYRTDTSLAAHSPQSAIGAAIRRELGGSEPDY